MGEMADFFLDSVMDEEDARLSYRTGGMGIKEALDRGIIDVRGYEALASTGRPIVTTCKWCKTDGLVWAETPRGWRLASATGEIHSCREYKRADA